MLIRCVNPALSPVLLEGLIAQGDYNSLVCVDAGIDGNGSLTLRLAATRPARASLSFDPRCEQLLAQITYSLTGRSESG